MYVCTGKGNSSMRRPISAESVIRINIMSFQKFWYICTIAGCCTADFPERMSAKNCTAACTEVSRKSRFTRLSVLGRSLGISPSLHIRYVHPSYTIPLVQAAFQSETEPAKTVPRFGSAGGGSRNKIPSSGTQSQRAFLHSSTT